MSIDDASAWAEREREVLDALERELHDQPLLGREGAWRYPTIPRWSALLMSLSLLFADGVMLAMAVQVGAVALWVAAVAFFPVVFLPQLGLIGRSGWFSDAPKSLRRRRRCAGE